MHHIVVLEAGMHHQRRAHPRGRRSCPVADSSEGLHHSVLEDPSSLGPATAWPTHRAIESQRGRERRAFDSWASLRI